MTDLPWWDRLTGLLTDDPRVAELVRRSVTDPEGYLADHDQDPLQRGIDDPDEVSGLLTLIDALAETRQLAYLDWKADAAEVAAQLAALPRVRAAGVDLRRLEDVAGGIEPVVAAANGLLAPADLAIVMLDEDSDAYPLVAVPRDRVAEVVEAAAAVDAEARLLA